MLKIPNYRQNTKRTLHLFIPYPSCPWCPHFHTILGQIFGFSSEDLTPDSEHRHSCKQTSKTRGLSLNVMTASSQYAAGHPSLLRPHFSPLSPMWEHSFALSSILSSRMNSSQTAAVRTKQAFIKTLLSRLASDCGNVL